MKYKNKNILVTGANGFMGSHLVERLLEEQAEVTAFVKSTSTIGTTQHDLKNLNEIKHQIKIIAGDISCKDTVTLIKKANPDIIFHLAAIAYVPYSFDHPLEVMNVNVGGTLNVLEAARDLNCKRIVVTSSSEIYGTALKPKIDEGHPINPTSPYGASKLAADRFAYSYWNTYGLPVNIICPFNTYGPKHTYDVIPKFIDLALQNKPLTIYGDGKQARDLTYVDDMINAFLLMGKIKMHGQRINFGNGKAYSVNFMAKLVKKFSNSKSKIVHIEKRMAEVKRLCCDNTKALDLGWKPEISLFKGIRRNIEWEKYKNGWT